MTGRRTDHLLPLRASAPVRICDHGGWTDTWFGGPGRVLNIAVNPGVHVEVRAHHGRGGVVINAANFGDRYSIVPGSPRAARHRLLEAAVDELPPPDDLAVEIRVRSAMPAGCGTGTSAAVAVALLGALAALRGERLDARDAAYAAYRLEVAILGGESGIQDQLSSAYGGINYVEIDSFPEATVTPLPPWYGLDRLLTLVYLGQAHDSSAVHRQVIAELSGRGSPALSRLRDAATAARDAVVARDLIAFGRAMILNTEAQESLHPALVGIDSRRVMAVASARHAIGWKVNGAGGQGGSLTILSPTESAKKALETGIAAMDSGFRIIPVRTSAAGLQVVSPA